MQIVIDHVVLLLWLLSLLLLMRALHSCRRLLLQLLMLQRRRRPAGVLSVVIRGVASGMVCKLRAALDGKLHLIPSACIVMIPLKTPYLFTPSPCRSYLSLLPIM